MKNKEQTTDQLKLYFMLASMILAIVGFCIVLWSQDMGAVLLFLFMLAALSTCYIWGTLMIEESVRYSESLNKSIAQIMENPESLDLEIYGETLFSKNQAALKKLSDYVLKIKRDSHSEKIILQEVISDISHQVKTPMANIKLYIELLENPDMLLKDKSKYFKILTSQIEKIEFLMISMIKMSRMETGLLVLDPRPAFIYRTLALAVEGVILNAEKKNVEIKVNCPEDLRLLHDTQWTAEALFNIVDNAVKYSYEGEDVYINVLKQEFYARIDIINTGMGVIKHDIPSIFKRFYRGKNAVLEQGAGIGLYLAREILTLEQGFVTVSSEEGKSTVFSIYLLNL